MKKFLYFFDIQLADAAEDLVFLHDIADLHHAVDGAVVRKGNDAVVPAVELLAHDARAERVAVEPDHQVDHRGAVVDLDGLGVVVHGRQLLGKVEGVVAALLKGEEGVVAQLLAVDLCAVGKRVVFPQKDIGLAVHQLVELNVVRAEDLRDDVAVEVAEVEDADLATQACDVVDDLARLALTDGEIVFGGVEALGHLHEGLDREGIVLRRHAELLFQLVGMRVLLRQRLVLVVDLTGIVDELLPVVRQRHAASAAVEDGDAELTLQLLHRAGERGLGDVEPFRRLVHRAGLGNDDGIVELLERHGRIPPCTE